MRAKAIGSFVSFCKDHRIADKLKYFGANLVRFVTAIGWLFIALYVYGKRAGKPGALVPG
jgi:hypothetical protein